MAGHQAMFIPSSPGFALDHIPQNCTLGSAKV